MRPKRKKSDDSNVDQMLISALTNSNSPKKIDSADEYFCLSLVEAMQSFSQKKKLIIRSKIMMLVAEELEE